MKSIFSVYLLAGYTDMKHATLIRGPRSEYFIASGYAYIGEVEVDLPELDQEALLRGTVQALKQQAQNIRAEAEVAAQKIDEQVQKLLALPMPANVDKEFLDDETIPF